MTSNSTGAVLQRVGCSRAVGVPAAVEPALHRASLHAPAAPVAAAGLQVTMPTEAQQVHERPRHWSQVAPIT
jgi:hypothetical protein